MHNSIRTPNSRCLSLGCDVGLQGSMVTAFREATAVLGGTHQAGCITPTWQCNLHHPIAAALPQQRSSQVERTAIMQGVPAHRTHLSLAQHAHSLRGGLPVGAEAPEDADGLRHEADMAHHCHPCAHYRSSGCLPRAAPACAKTRFGFWRCHRVAREVGCAHATHSRPQSGLMTAPNPWPFRREMYLT